MGIAEFTIPTELMPEIAGDVARRVGTNVVRVLFNGKSDDLVAKLEASELKGSIVGRGSGQYDFGFELWSGSRYLGDVYLRADGANSKVRVDFEKATQNHADILLRKYLDG